MKSLGILLSLLLPFFLFGQSDAEIRARNLMQNYQYSKAASLLQSALKQDTANENLQFLLASAYEKSGQQADARQLYQKMLETDSTNLRALMRIGKVCAATKDYNSAYEYFKTLTEIDNENSYFHKLAGEIAEKIPLQIGKAVDHYQQAMALNPRDQQAGHALAQLYLNLKQYPSAKAITQKFLSRDSSYVAILLLDIKLSYLQQNYHEVVKTSEFLLSRGDSLTSALRMYGITLYQLGRYSEALNWLGHVESIAASEQVYFYLAMAHYRTGDYALAEEYLSAAITHSQSPNLADFYTQQAMLYEVQQKYPEAIKAYKEAYKLNENQNLLYRLARISDEYYKDNRVAEGYYRKFLASTDTAETPHRVYSEERLAEIQRIRFFKTDTM